MFDIHVDAGNCRDEAGAYWNDNIAGNRDRLTILSNYFVN
jgi:hypothetical protein